MRIVFWLATPERELRHDKNSWLSRQHRFGIRNRLDNLSAHRDQAGIRARSRAFYAGMDGGTTMKPRAPIRQQIRVTWDFPVIFTHALFAPENRIFADTLDRLHEQRRHR